MNIKTQKITRRNFIKLLSSLGAVVCLPFNATAYGDSKLRRVSSARLAMGTTVDIILIYKPGSDYHAAMEDAFAEIKRLADLMNYYDPNSQLSKLNAEGHLENADPAVIEVFRNALKYYKLTKGAFDVTVLPILQLYQRKFDKNTRPTDKEIHDVLQYVGSDKIKLKGRNIILEKKGMEITLAGLAKGYIVDRASKVLLNHGIKNHLINAGGDIMAVGLRGDGKPWKVAIQDPQDMNNYLDIIELTNKAVATSGNYENYFDPDKKFYHITNPKTGFSPAVNSSTSVIAPTTMESDALATALMVMSPDHGIKFINSLPECECLIITRDEKLFRSSGWKSIPE